MGLLFHSSVGLKHPIRRYKLVLVSKLVFWSLVRFLSASYNGLPLLPFFKQIRVRVEASGGVGHLNSAPGNDPSVQPPYVFVVVLCFAQIWPVIAQTKEL